MEMSRSFNKILKLIQNLINWTDESEVFKQLICSSV